MNRQLINKNLISINDLKMRMILNNMMKYVFDIENIVMDTKSKTETPVDFSEITNSIQSKFAEQSISSSNLINQKINEFHNTISKYVQQFQSLNVDEINTKINTLTKMVSDIEKKIIELDKNIINIEGQPKELSKTTEEKSKIKKAKIEKKQKKTSWKKK